MSNANSIKVVARFRPQNKIELASGGTPIVNFDGADTCAIEVWPCPPSLPHAGAARERPVVVPDTGLWPNPGTVC